MTQIDRRTLLRQILPGAAAVVAGMGTVGAASGSLISQAVAMPLALDKVNPLSADVEQLFQKTQAVVIVPPRRRRVRRRRWTCWWYRGRRRCGYRSTWVWI